MNVLSLEELLAELHEQLGEDADFDITIASSWMRYAYGHAYLSALKNAQPDIEEARRIEREAWARLP